MNATIEKFGYPATLIARFDHWLVLLRPAQPTLGSLVLAAKGDATAFGDLPGDAHAELKTVTATIEAALAKAGEDKARVMAELRAVAGAAWTRADQKSRQLWFALGGAAAGILAWAVLPGLVAREIAPTSWQWPERMAARTLDLPRWEAGQRMMQSADPAAFRAVVAADRIVTANRETIEGCSKAAVRARETVRCTIKVGASLEEQQDSDR